MLIFFTTTLVFALECKLGEIGFIKVNDFPVFTLHMVKLLYEFFALELKLLLIIWWQVFLLSNFLSFYFMFEI